MSKSLSVAYAAAIPAVLAVGLTAGVMLRPMLDDLIGEQEAGQTGHVHADGTVHIDDDDSPFAKFRAEQAHQAELEEANHIPLTLQAYQNLRLTVAPVELSTYTRLVRMPGEVVEAPGYSSRKVAAPVSGRVTRLFTAPGVAVEPGQPLAVLEIIDDELMQAQLKLLELLTKQEIIQAELDRLAPLTVSGGVAGRKRLEFEYQNKETTSSLSRTRQELAMRGLSKEQVSQIESSRRAISQLTIRTPDVWVAEEQSQELAERVKLSSYEEEIKPASMLHVEELLVEVGQNLKRGEPVCDLAAHGLLMVCGHAFENEVGLVTNLAGRELPVSIELGMHGHSERVDGLRVQYVAGHADLATQNYYFYLPLANHVVGESADAAGRAYRTWRYKVGQRVHVLAPADRMTDQIVLPRAAVMQQGGEAIVFRVLDEEPPAKNGDEGLGDQVEIYIEFEPVPVTILAQDKDFAVIGQSELLALGDQVALNAAYQLFLTHQSLKEDGSGGHDHHHH